MTQKVVTAIAKTESNLALTEALGDSISYIIDSIRIQPTQFTSHQILLFLRQKCCTMSYSVSSFASKVIKMLIIINLSPK